MERIDKKQHDPMHGRHIKEALKNIHQNVRSDYIQWQGYDRVFILEICTPTFTQKPTHECSQQLYL